MPADGVNFVDEDDAGSILLALLEKIADAAGADANKHLHEVRAGNRKERNVGFAGDSACEKGLARARRANQQNPFGNAAAKFLEFLRVFQELDNLLKFFLGFIGSGNIFKSGFFLLRGKQTRARFAEAQSLVAAGLHLAHQKQAEANQEEKREAIKEEKDPVGAANFLDFDLHGLVAQLFGDAGGIFLGNGHLELAVGRADVLALEVVADLAEVHGDFFDVTGFDLGHELAVARLIFAGLPAVRGDQFPEHHSQQDNGHPEENCFYRRTGIHVSLSNSGSRTLPLSCFLFSSFSTLSGQAVRSRTKLSVISVSAVGAGQASLYC